MVVPADVDGLSNAELKALVAKLLAEGTELKRRVSEQREEIARLKGLKGRPQIKPSGMEKASEPKPAAVKNERRRGGRAKRAAVKNERRRDGGKTATLVIHDDRIIKAEVPAGSRFKGYEDFVV